MDRYRQGSATLAYRTHKVFLAGSVLVSLGIMISAAGGSWDITNHLLNKLETFLAPPHAILYSGVGTSVAGAIMLLYSSRSAGKIIWPAKLALAGVALLVSAGPVDFAWHSVYGLDGLFSPPHFVLVSGMVASSLGGLASIIYYKGMSLLVGQRMHLHPALIIIGMLPLWIALTGMVDLFTLPFSSTKYFNFDPDPATAVVVATTAFPFIVAASLCGASALSGRRFGVISLTGAAFMAMIVLTSIVPSDSLHATIPFYLLSLIPIVAADAVMSYRFWRPFGIPVYVAGAILGLTFFMLYYPLITHTYNELVNKPRIVWPSVTAGIYFELLQTVYPLLVVPSAAMGTFGAIVANKLGTKKVILEKSA